MPFSKLAIEYHIDRHRRPRIELNGEAVPGLIGLTVEWGVEHMTVATLTIAVDELHVDTETMIQLRALMEGREQPETSPTVAAPLPGDEL